MAKKKKIVKKYYAIKEGIGTKDKIVGTWEICSKLVLGYNSVYKSFLTMKEAEEYLNNIDVEKIKEQTSYGIEKQKKIKLTTKLIQARIPKELCAKFEKKCNEYEWEVDKVLISLIEEWVD